MMINAGYLLLDTENLAGYLRGLGHWDDAPIEVREVSDGNLNRVFIASAPDGGRGLAVKQALPWVRVAGPSWPLSPDRADAEARAYRQVADVAPDVIPRLHGYDPDNHALTMEDMSDLKVLRTHLNEGGGYGDASVRIGEFSAGLAFATSDFGMPSEQRKALIAASANPELCKITEDVVLSEPYIEHEHNHWHPGLAELAAKVHADARLRTEVAALRHAFMSDAQALVHGDLHTGSIMVGTRDGAEVVRVFDPEFAFVGPVGFDLGVYWGNVLIAEARAQALGTVKDHAEQIAVSWDAFVSELRRRWPERVDTFFDDAYLDRFLRRVWTDALGFAGTEMIRRVIGYAHVGDLTTLPDPLPASRAVLLLGRALILGRDRLDGPGAIRELVDGLAVGTGAHR
ncbi:MAG TPA: S-methyl-5-thioribose kinase [Actinospica sp.]|jgi:5-methylthioribose kinase|nr:S-methyl-5-thioribose kinase [Actinospica sp.]